MAEHRPSCAVTGTGRRLDWGAAAIVGAVAFMVRLWPVIGGGGLLFVNLYDDGVYYAAAASLVDGRVPYRDFVLLHPPLIAVALAPFALLGRLTSDPVGLAAARITWMLLGALTAVLVARIAGRWGRAAGWIAGLAYACTAAAAVTEQVTYIEPLPGLLLVAALGQQLGTNPAPSSRRDLLTAALLGIALTGKIWYVVPVAILLGWMLVVRGRMVALRVGAGAVAVAAVVLLPFLALAPGPLWRMVVVDQLTRLPGTPTPLTTKLAYLTGVEQIGLPGGVVEPLAVVLTLAWVVALVACLRDRRLRLVALMGLGEVAVALRAPVFIGHYAHLPAACLVLTLVLGWRLLALAALRRLEGESGERLDGRLGRRRSLVRGVVVSACLLLLVAGGVAFARQPVGQRLPAAQVRRALPAGCITADDPTVLAVVDRLSSDLAAGCPVAVDVTGDSYGSSVYRTENTAYQRRLLDYLASGSASIVRRHTADGLTSAQVSQLGRTVVRARHLRVLLPGPRTGR